MITVCEHDRPIDVECLECVFAKSDAAKPLTTTKRKLTGGSSDYYKVNIASPTSGGAPYTAECNDIIEAMNMEYDVANVFKAAWRIAALRQGHGKPGQDSPVYDAEKVVFFGQRIITREQVK